MTADLAARRATFAALHRGPAPLLLPNAWDVASALALVADGHPAIGTTSLRFFSMSSDRAVSSPLLVLLPRSISSSCVRSLSRAICPKYLARGFGVSLSFILLIASRVI